MLMKTSYLSCQNGRSILSPYHPYQDVCVNIFQTFPIKIGGGSLSKQNKCFSRNE